MTQDGYKRCLGEVFGLLSMYCAKAESCVDKPSSWQNTEVALKSIVQLYLAVSCKASRVCVTSIER